MTHYNYGQLEQLWINAGGSKTLAPLMAAIAMAESGGNSDAENRTDNNGTQTSWGLWQISDGTHNEPVPNILDASVNARAAVQKWKDQGLGAWGTYTSGAYLQFLQGNVPAEANLPPSGSGNSPSGTKTTGDNPSPFGWFSFIGSGILGNLLAPGSGYVGSFSNPISPIEDMAHGVKIMAADFARLMTWVAWLFAPANWLRIGAFVFGLIVLGASFYMFKEAL
jgi:hypothetical protein